MDLLCIPLVCECLHKGGRCPLLCSRELDGCIWTFVAPGNHHVILYFADLPAEFNSPVQQQFSSLGAHFNYQIPSVFPGFVAEFSFNVTYLPLTSLFCANRMSSTFPMEISSGMLMITSLGFLSLRALASSLPSHLSFMAFCNASNSSFY